MILSQPPTYTFLNYGNLAILLLIFIGAAFFLGWKYETRWYEKFKSENQKKIWPSTLLIFILPTLIIIGIVGNGRNVESRFHSKLREELTIQTQTVYGVTLDDTNLNRLTELSSDVVGSEDIGTIMTNLFTDTLNDEVFKYQVSSTGYARLLTSELDFKEVALKEEMIEVEPLIEEEIVELESPADFEE